MKKTELIKTVNAVVRNVYDDKRPFNFTINLREGENARLLSYAKVKLKISDNMAAAIAASCASLNGLQKTVDSKVYSVTSFPVEIKGLLLGPKTTDNMGLEVTFYTALSISKDYTLDVIQENMDNLVMGGTTLNIHSPAALQIRPTVNLTNLGDGVYEMSVEPSYVDSQIAWFDSDLTYWEQITGLR